MIDINNQKQQQSQQQQGQLSIASLPYFTGAKAFRDAISSYTKSKKLVYGCIVRDFLSSNSDLPDSQTLKLVGLYLLVVLQAVEDALMTDEEVYTYDATTGQYTCNVTPCSEVKQTLRGEARAWIFKEEHNNDFLEVCYNANLEPSCIRSKVRRELNSIS